MALSVGNNNASTTFSAALNGPGSLTKIGSGALTIAGSNDNNSLGVTVSAGTLVLGKSSGGGVHAVGGPGMTVNSGALVQLGGSGGQQFYNWAAVTVASGGAFDTAGLSDVPYVINLAGTGSNGAGAGELSRRQFDANHAKRRQHHPRRQRQHWRNASGRLADPQLSDH